MMQKLVINEMVQHMGLGSVQRQATLLDGITRHSPEGVWFKRLAESQGFKAAVQWRDSGDRIAPGVSKL